ncbi:MAG TPA: hypothetical protein VJ801_12640 [Polyangia bacterium]|nr:hypothetical protein [Polyangia bacterium]
MFETFFVFGLVAYLFLLAVPGAMWQLSLGALVALVGLVGGGGAGIVYHLALRRTLVRLGSYARGWLWSPVSLHRLLDERGRREVLPWFRVGAVGFFLCLAGIGMVAVAIFKVMLAG